MNLGEIDEFLEGQKKNYWISGNNNNKKHLSSHFSI